MALVRILPVVLVAAITQCRPDSGYHHNENAASKFGELLKPPPPPLSQILPVPFHVATRSQRQKNDGGYIYQPPPPPPPIPPSNDFKFPSPFYKQYNFNFVPPPQPFTSTPAPSLFQKVSGWLFSSQQNGYDAGPQPVKKDCNSCNLLPWIPVIRYDLSAKNVQQNVHPTYGPPSATAFSHIPTQYVPQPFNTQNFQSLPQVSSGVPHEVYGPPPPKPLNTIQSATYGPPSPTHTVGVPSATPLSSTYSAAPITSSYGVPSSSYGVPSSSIGQPSSSYGAPSSSIGQPSSSYGVPSSSIGQPSSSYGLQFSSTASTSTYAPPSATYGAASPLHHTSNSVSSSYSSVESSYNSGNDLAHTNGLEGQGSLSSQELPSIKPPTGFKNSYGETISNDYSLNVPYPVSATAAESSKIKTEVLPFESKKIQPSNGSLALGNPSPFTLNRGRNIHTLQPVALPNLSVSPLPPIFNARPFRPITSIKNILQGSKQTTPDSNNVKITQSIPIAEYTHSIDYPISIVQSPVIDVGTTKFSNFTKAFRNIPNGYIVDELRDITSQASEDHVAATKSNQDISFESTGPDVGNYIYDTGMPIEMKQTPRVPSNHKPEFADLRGMKDEDIDKYRTENNLQSIDSPLLYLKPSAPHKDHVKFLSSISTPGNTGNDYELYDDVSTTPGPQLPVLPSSWEESKTDYAIDISPPPFNKNDGKKPKIVQIIVPYTTNQQEDNTEYDPDANVDGWGLPFDDGYIGRKAPTNTEKYMPTVTENYSTFSSTTEDPMSIGTEPYESEKLNTQAILNDLYDVKEPPFDIVKLQHTIDDWTAQEFTKNKRPPKVRAGAKYSKQIPDEYFTTLSPISNYVTETTNYNYDYFDHEGSSSMHHTVTDQNESSNRPHKEYNVIERTKNKFETGKNKDDPNKLHIYTAASSFRSSSTTPAPWGTIPISISPLTKEKVYVVTSKPWTDSFNNTKDWYGLKHFESQKSNLDNDVTASDNMPFKSPRFSNRPSFDFTSNTKTDSLKSDSSYGFSKDWHQSINDLETQRNATVLLEGSGKTNTTREEVTTTTELHKDE